MKKVFFVLASYCFMISAKAQSIQELTVGDLVPDLPLNNMINYSAVRTGTAAFSDKLLILDFWNTSCKSCIAAWPKMQQLQKDYGNRIQVILVNSEPQFDTKERLEKFFKDRRDRKLMIPDLPMKLGDSLFKKVFPYFTVPHIVWINKNKIIAITDNKYLTKENLEKAFQNNLQLPLKIAHAVNFDALNTPLLLYGNGGPDSSYVYRSIFTKEKEGLPGLTGIRKSSSKKVIGYVAANAGRFILYTDYMLNKMRQKNKSYEFDRKLLDLQIKDTVGFFPPNDIAEIETYRKYYTYCYDISLAEDIKSDIFELMKKDLDAFFGYESKIESRMLSCYKLIRTSDKDKLASKGGEVFYNFEEPEAKWIIVNNSNWSGFFTQGVAKNKFIENLPIIVDETGYKGYVDITLKPKTNDFTGLKKELNKYDLDLVETTRAFDVLVIKDAE